MRKVSVLALALGALATWSAPASAIPINWINGGALGTWTTPPNWSPNQVPMAADDATITNGGTANQTGLPISTRDLNIGLRTSGTFGLPHGTGTVKLTNGNAMVAGELNVGVTDAGIGTQGFSTGTLTTTGIVSAPGDVDVGDQFGCSV